MKGLFRQDKQDEQDFLESFFIPSILFILSKKVSPITAKDEGELNTSDRVEAVGDLRNAGCTCVGYCRRAAPAVPKTRKPRRGEQFHQGHAAHRYPPPSKASALRSTAAAGFMPKQALALLSRAAGRRGAQRPSRYGLLEQESNLRHEYYEYSALPLSYPQRRALYH